jgi:hypothetical protein
MGYLPSRRYVPMCQLSRILLGLVRRKGSPPREDRRVVSISVAIPNEQVTKPLADFLWYRALCRFKNPPSAQNDGELFRDGGAFTSDGEYLEL